MSTLILVPAHDHPEPDEWVHEQAAVYGRRMGLVPGDYIGREDKLPDFDPTAELQCHVFSSRRGDGG